MENKQINEDTQNQVIKKRDYLTTEKINLGNFSANKISDDLTALLSAEEVKVEKPKTLIPDQQVTKEMLALKLANPFRGY